MDDLALPVRSDKLEEHYKQVRDWHDRERRRHRNSKWLSYTLVGVFAAIAAASNISNAILQYRAQPDIVPIVMHKDGSTDVAWSWRDLLISDRQAAVDGVLWYYVTCRESYNWQDAKRCYDAVSAMSVPGVRDVYQRSILPSNKQSPLLTIGEHGQAWVRFDGFAYEKGAPIVYVTFYKTVQMDGSPPQTTHWTATISYAVNAPTSAWDRIRYHNPEGIIVTSYAVRELSTP
jgi:type IV secretory pathway component VirB8